MENSRQNVLSNLIWRFAERCGAQIVQFVVSIILARILAPELYGTIALVTVFIAILQVFVDSGLGNALIQKKEADDIDFSTVFYTNLVFCIILYIIIFLSAPLIADFYNNQSLISLTRVLGLTIIISGIKNIQQAYVSKNMIFKKFFFSTLSGTIGAAILGIFLAIKGFGVWALVGQQLFNLTLDTIILWITVEWRPKLVFSFNRLKSLFSYGWKLLVTSLINIIYQDIRQLIIGKVYSSSDLAYFNRGQQFPNVIVSNVNTSIDSVLLPTLSNVQENKKRVKEMTRRTIKTGIYIMAPLMIGLVATSNNVVKLLLTEKWLPCVPYLCLFCITYMFYPIHTANLNAIKAMGRSDLCLKLEIIKKTIDVILLVYTMRISVLAMGISLLVSSITSQIINAWPNKKLLDYSYLNQIKDIMPSVLLSLFMGAIVYGINFVNLSILITLIIQVILGGIIYLVGSKIFKLESYNYLQDTLKNYFNVR